MPVLSWFTCAVAIVPVLSPPIVSAASLEEWKSRSIYQVLTDRFARPLLYLGGETCNVADGLYCGGTWNGITEHLDYIQGMNFDAIWISPITKQLPEHTGDGEAYAGYWQQDLYSLNYRFGTELDLKTLVQAAHERGMYVMLDIVVNHVANYGPGWQLDVKNFWPFDDHKYFHQYCDIPDSRNLTMVEVCYLGSRAVSLADLRTEDADVQEMFSTWISSLIADYSFDGLRIDTAINVNKTFFTKFMDAAGVFATGEVMHGDDSLACQWEATIGSILNYPIYYPLIRAFQSPKGSIGDLVETIHSVQQNCKDPTALGSFSENHDVKRFASHTNDTSLAKNIIAFTILSDGIPIVYQGQEQHMAGTISPYTNRAPLWQTGYNTASMLYKHIATLNRFRQHVGQTNRRYTQSIAQVIRQDYHTLVTRKGIAGSQVITVLDNNGEAGEDFSLPLINHGFTSGTELTEVLSCTNLTVNSTGHLNVPMGRGLPKVLYPVDLMCNSTLCSMSDCPSPITPSVTTTATAGPSATRGLANHDGRRRPASSTVLTILLTILSLTS